MPCYSPLKGWVKHGGGFTCDATKGVGTKMEVACGQCLGCRLDHARMWSMRIIHEASMFDGSNGSCFVTLTYDDEHLDSDWSLRKRDFQLFMKRLRRKLKRAPGDGVRFFMCGEYGIICRHGLATDDNDFGMDICEGCGMGRPHFHAILFNLGFDDLVLFSERDNVKLFTSNWLDKRWENGFCTVGEVTMQSAGYVARYAVKKITGKSARDHYVTFDDQVGFVDISPEFSTQSNRPGIGKDWFLKFKTDVFPSDEVPVPGEGVFKKVPRYYQDIMAQTDEEIIEEVKSRRLKYLKENKGEFSPERLMAKYKVKKAQVSSLKRKM